MHADDAVKMMCSEMSKVRYHLEKMKLKSFVSNCCCSATSVQSKPANPEVSNEIVEFIRDAINHKINLDQYEKLKKEVEELEDELVVVTNKLKNKNEELSNSYPY